MSKQIKGFVGEFQNYALCVKCGCELRNDHGWLLKDGTALCVHGDRCAKRVSRKKIEEQKAAGTWAPRWVTN